MKCKTCQHRRARTESKAGGHVLIWGCSKIKQKDGKGIRFGYQWEYQAGKNMRKSCVEYLKGTPHDECADLIYGLAAHPLQGAALNGDKTHEKSN
ncbi:MAG: hypothetical protein WC236_15315 [Gallionellaceae bacterium]|jgi:hypothetical protein